MKLLIIGSGGREHALAWKLSQAARVEEIIVAPGNGGTASTPKTGNVALSTAETLAFAVENGVDLTVVGPEVPLAEGIVDAFQAEGQRIWGPIRAAARIEASKAFAKAFMERHNVPTGGFAAFTEFEAARDYLLDQTEPVVIKASGLAAGKGVILPDSTTEGEVTLREIMLDKRFGQAGEEVLIEERLTGPEVSVFAFCDGQDFVLMPPAQDHKRAFENDEGPNTGGMGAYAPAPICPPDLLEQIGQTVIRPTLNGLRAEGAPFVGVLYAGLMLTPDGPKVLEFNCRFGDPEAQVLLPLLDSNLLDIIEASVDGTLSEVEIRWREDAAATVVLAAGGYPGRYAKNKVVSGLAEAATLSGVTVFHAGTGLTDSGEVVTAGGRVLNVTGQGATLKSALDRAYEGVGLIRFDEMHFRRDIGAKALR